MFSRVWGAAEGTAERWYQAGCRSLADVAALPHLTEQQRTGLKYFHDFDQRIPRAEVAECEGIMCGVVLGALEVRTPGGRGG